VGAAVAGRPAAGRTRLGQPSADAKHFLGAIVVQAQEPILGDLQASSIIDGQQRLTTLQLLIDVTAAALEEIGQDALAGQLDWLTHNENIYVPGTLTRLKLRHSNRDRDAFDEAMDAEAPVDHETLRHSAARVVRAHDYFTMAVTEWLDSGTDQAAERAQALTGVLTRGLQLVAINLTVSENSQEIFDVERSGYASHSGGPHQELRLSALGRRGCGHPRASRRLAVRDGVLGERRTGRPRQRSESRRPPATDPPTGRAVRSLDGCSGRRRPAAQPG